MWGRRKTTESKNECNHAGLTILSCPIYDPRDKINSNNKGRVFQYIFNNLIHFDQNINMYANQVLLFTRQYIDQFTT